MTLALTAPAGILAQTPPGAPDWIKTRLADRQAELAALEASSALGAARIKKLKDEIEALGDDRDKHNATLIAAGERIKRAEPAVASAQGKIDELVAQEVETRARLAGADASVSSVLAALARISFSPPPALIVDPSDALGSARGALLIAALIPQLKQRTEAVKADIARLAAIRAEAEAEKAALKASFDVLEEEQLRIATLIAARQTGAEATLTGLASAEAEAMRAVQRAYELKADIERLGRELAAVAVSPAPADGKRPDEGGVRLAFADSTRTAPALPFSSARGYLAFPVAGVNTVSYGDGDRLGGISKGLAVVTRAQAPVVAPADGTVVYAGTYLDYGGVVIFDVGEDYTVLLAGLGVIGVREGQFVRIGEAVGAMGTAGSLSAAVGSGADRPTLYIELHNKRVPIDPTGWWAAQSG